MELCRMNWVVLAAVVCTGVVQAEVKHTPEQIKFFETQVKPVLEASCFKCHGAEKKIKGNLRMTSRKGILKGGDLGPAVELKNPKASLVLVAINYTDDDMQMPPKTKLSQDKIDILTKWVEMGLPFTGDVDGPGKVAPGNGKPAAHEITPEAKAFWSHKPIKRSPLPSVKDKAWAKSAIDRFILAKLEAAGLKPSSRAGKVALIRRAYYDLIGLPPKPADVEAFLADKSPTAFEKIVDELLDSPHYGEKWGRHWLDLVHYAESNSFERDNPKPDVWRYRDYVIRAFNENKPYDDFLREQLAGDELENPTPDSIIATGYYRLGLWDDESADPPKARFDEIDDWVTVTGQVMLGMTMNCARCHHHKIDPVSMTDYYGLVAIFRDVNSFQAGHDGMSKRFNKGNYHRKLSDFIPQDKLKSSKVNVVIDENKLKRLNDELAKMEAEISKKLPGGVVDDFKYESNRVTVVRKHAKLLPKGMPKRYQKTFDERNALRRQKELKDIRVLAASSTPNPPDTHILLRGSPRAKGKKVEPGFPQIFSPPKPLIKKKQRSTGRRLAFANWLTSKSNPRTARVMANRIWQHHMGRGIVRSANDFGLVGEKPTHPELLDWLASEFMAKGWSMKAMHRLIMLSNTWQMSSAGNETALAKDPANNLFWRYNLRRQTAEEIRDSVLALVGTLNLKMYGPSIYPEIEREILASQSRPGANWRTSRGADAARRSVYIHVKRSLIVPIIERFDAADTDATCPVRFNTIQPSQALTTINGKFMNDASKVFAARLIKEAGDRSADQVKLALRLTTAREPSDEEVDWGVKLIDDLMKEDGADSTRALQYFCVMALNLNEFMYVD